MTNKDFHFNTSFAFPISIIVLLAVAWFGAHEFSVRAANKLILNMDKSPASRQPLPAFQLEATDHTLFTNENLQQHWTLLLVGFTRCKDICPVSLSLVNRIYNTLIQDHPFLQVVFISVDPLYDSSQRLRQYLSGFNKHFLGVTGDSQQLAMLQKNLGIAAHESLEGTLLHSKTIFLVDPSAQVYAKFTNTTNLDTIIRVFENGVVHQKVDVATASASPATNKSSPHA